MTSQFFLYVGATVGALLPIVNPFSTAPVFLSLTSGVPSAFRQEQAKKACIYMGGILLVTLFAGALVLSFFGITLPILQMAGGLIIARSGLKMLEPVPGSTLTVSEREEAQARDDIAFTPLAMPLLAGPGSIAVTIALATESSTVVSYVGIAVGTVAVTVIAWLTLLAAASAAKWISQSGMNVVTRVMGLILICIGIRFLATGFIAGLTGEAVTTVLREWLQSL
jgi:multiple antibiotic resistance protein